MEGEAADDEESAHSRSAPDGLTSGKRAESAAAVTASTVALPHSVLSLRRSRSVASPSRELVIGREPDDDRGCSVQPFVPCTGSAPTLVISTRHPSLTELPLSTTTGTHGRPAPSDSHGRPSSGESVSPVAARAQPSSSS